MQTFAELESKVIDWAKARKIIPNATPASQLLKLMSELGELAVAKSRRAAKDGVGDVLVCLINYCALKGFALGISNRVYVKTLPDLVEAVGLLADAENKGRRELADDYATLLLNRLHGYCKLHSLDIVECLAVAYEEIKDRKGTLMPNGVFVKEGDDGSR